MLRLHEAGLPALRSGFVVDVVLPPGPASLVLEGKRGAGEWQPFLTRRVRGSLLRAPRRDQEEAVESYAEWIRLYDSPTKQDIERIRQHIAALEWKPTFSILLPVYNSTAKWLRRAIDSAPSALPKLAALHCG